MGKGRIEFDDPNFKEVAENSGINLRKVVSGEDLAEQIKLARLRDEMSACDALRIAHLEALCLKAITSLRRYDELLADEFMKELADK